MAKSKKKNFVLDTSVILHSPYCLDSFEDNNIYIPAIVLEELDKLKTGFDSRSYNAREFIRQLESYRSTGDLLGGVKLKNGGKLFVRFHIEDKGAPIELGKNINDNFILKAALNLKSKSSRTTVLVSKDVNLRIKAEVIGIKAEDYYHEKSFQCLNSNDIIYVSSDENIDKIYEKNLIDIDEIEVQFDQNSETLPDYAIVASLMNSKKTALCRIVNEESSRKLELLKNQPANFYISPLNYKQKFLYDALMRDDIKLVFAIGFAGTGKTLLSIASGLSQVLTQKYKKMVITRSHVPMGRDLGYLPGNLNEKLEPWLKPIYDNMELILDNISEDKQPASKDNALLKKHMNELTLDYLKSTNFVEVEAINFIRGRTFHDSFLIIDEAQNLTPHEVKTIITRAGQNTKIVMTGDPSQIDNPYLDEKDNGLVYSSERFKKNKSKIAASIILDKCERSEIAQEASDFLK